MAYIQNPGRGNNPKTGHGLPSALKQIDPPKGKPEVVTEASAKIHKELNAAPVAKAKQYQTEYDDKTGFKPKESNIKTVMSGDNILRVQGGKTVASISKNDKVGSKKFMSQTSKLAEDQYDYRSNTARHQNERKASADINYKK